jgi:transketolase
MTGRELDQLCINTIRFLAVDAVQKADSGHPGLPLGAAPMAYVLWTRFLRHNPSNPTWWDRDRFVLSAGHGSMLLYALLHLTGYRKVTLEQIERFRQWGSITPGHPESHLTEGVETTTGPLGQGLGNALGMAIAEAHLAARYNRPGHEIFNHATYALASDGDLMEGVGAEAASLAGHLQLGKLIVLYDNNHVTLSATTNVAFSEDVPGRFAALGWHVQQVSDGNDLLAIEKAVRAAREVGDKPSLISVNTILGYGAPDVQGTPEAHGKPLGPVEVAKTKKTLGWPEQPAFLIPPAALERFREAVPNGAALEQKWQRRFDAYAQEHPALASELRRRFQGALPSGWDARLPTFPTDAKGLSTRKASEKVLQVAAQAIPELVGGSGDLDPSTNTALKQDGDLEPPGRAGQVVQGAAGGDWSYTGRNIHFGVREHSMGAAVNGLACHGGFVPFGATFLVFSDYMRPPIRLAALARLGSVFVYTHDSIAVGEDGPSHQPVEQLASLRAIPGLVVIRPCDANETRVAWQAAIEERRRPTVLILTRQSVPTLDRDGTAPAQLLRRGAYVLNPVEANDPELILIASGSEVSLIVEAEAKLREQGVRARLVSMPCWRLFEEQPPEYRESVLPARVTARLAVEAASPFGWERFTGSQDGVLGVETFGASAPGPIVLEKYGFTPENVVRRALGLLGR